MRYALVCAVFLCGTARAQHSDISIYQNAGQIVTVDESNSERQVFLRSFDFFGHPFGNTSLPRVYSGDDPGFVAGNAPAGFSELPGIEPVSISFLPFDLGSGKANLFFWNATGEIEFNPVGENHSLYVSDINNTEYLLDGSPDKVVGAIAGRTDSQGGLHQHIQFRIDDNDNNSSTEPNRGIYLFGAQFAVDGVNDSEPLLIALSSPDVANGVEADTAQWLETTYDSLRFGSLGDFDQSGDLGIADIDALVAAIAAQSNPASFDLTGDAVVALDDLDTWRSIAGEALFGPGQSVARGDANLDGMVNEADLNIWFENRFTSTPAWSVGDFTADANIDVRDFNVWNDNRAIAAAVPEPSSISMAVCLLLLVARFRRKEQLA